MKNGIQKLSIDKKKNNKISKKFKKAIKNCIKEEVTKSKNKEDLLKFLNIEENKEQILGKFTEKFAKKNQLKKIENLKEFQLLKIKAACEIKEVKNILGENEVKEISENIKNVKEGKNKNSSQSIR